MDDATFQSLYEAYAGDVRRFARYLTGDEDAASEIVSDVFLRAWAGQERIRTETVKAYLLAIARNLAVDRLRRRRETVPINESNAVRPAAAEDELGLRRAVESLAEGLRTPLLLTAVHGLSYEETARVMNLSVAVVKVRIHRARVKLAALLEREKAR